MTPDEADGWLRVALNEVSDMPEDILADACRFARRTCTHHAQVIPAIIKDGDERINSRRRAAAPMQPIRYTVDEPAQFIPAPGEVEAIHAQVAKAIERGMTFEEFKAAADAGEI